MCRIRWWINLVLYIFFLRLVIFAQNWKTRKILIDYNMIMWSYISYFAFTDSCGWDTGHSTFAFKSQYYVRSFFSMVYCFEVCRRAAKLSKTIDSCLLIIFTYQNLLIVIDNFHLSVIIDNFLSFWWCWAIRRCQHRYIDVFEISTTAMYFGGNSDVFSIF